MERSRRHPFMILAIILLSIFWTSCDSRADLAKIRLVPAFPQLTFDRPLCVTFADDGSDRLYVVEQIGRIHVIDGTAPTSHSHVFLDITSRVRTVHNEEGLLSLAFHPEYSSNGHFFVYYSASNPRRTVLSRFSVREANPDVADQESEVVILEVEQPYGNHNGGTVLFGPDGYLYLSLGDGGSAGDPHGHGQNLASLLGKIIRIDVNRQYEGLPYSIPPDNPFVSRKNSRPEIWSYGLRNVWRMSFDRLTGDLWAGDVGQNKWEEIDVIVKGGNYGWNLREGAHPYKSTRPDSSLIEPVTEYGRSQGASVTGGYVYRGRKHPSLQGLYLYADFVLGTIWGLRYANGRVSESSILLEQPNNISSFGETADGELLVTCFDGHLYWITAD